MDLFVYKMTVAPTLVAGATLVGRRWGQTAAGMVAGLPIVAGPVLVFFALEQGHAYAAAAALATLLGLLSLCLFILAYAWRAWSGANPLSALVLGWLAFALGTALVQHLQPTPWKALAWALAALFLSIRSLPPAEAPLPTGPPSAWDLPLRMLAAAALVFGLTHFAEAMGPKLGGLLTPFPVASTVLAVFAHRQGGSAAAGAMLKGLLLALNAFAVFCAVLVFTLPSFSTLASFSLGLAAAFATQAAMVALRHRSQPAGAKV